MDRGFWKNKRVLLTGHTGFKGGWLSLWLSRLGAEVAGYALAPPTNPNFFDACGLEKRMTSITGDVRDAEHLESVCKRFKPEILIHMAAQAIVRQSYREPVETFETNVMGTVHVLEAARRCESIRAVLMITSDKCYENREWPWGYREIDPMGGHDPYAGSKGCAELVTASYRSSFFPADHFHEHGVALASARAGNVIGGGDWAMDRLVPDVCKAALAGERVLIRNPGAVRPWQHVLDPLHGYICLVERLYTDGPEFAQGWNFGPDEANCQPVSRLLLELGKLLGDRLVWHKDDGRQPHEAHFLKLDCSKAHMALNWKPRLNLSTALAWTVEWYRAFNANDDVALLSEKQIERYEEMDK